MLRQPSNNEGYTTMRWWFLHHRTGAELMNRIVYFVGLVVIVLFILGYFGLR
jgi:hypothetical protein